MDNCTSIYLTSIMCEWSIHGLQFHYKHDVMNYALVARIDILAVVSGSNMAVYSLYATTHCKFQYICACSINALVL